MNTPQIFVHFPKELCHEFDLLIKTELATHGLNYLKYDIVLPDGKIKSLCNHGDWMIHFLKNKFYQTEYLEGHPDIFSTKIILWTHLRPLSSKMLSDIREMLDISYGLTLIEKHHAFTEKFHFGGNSLCSHQSSNIQHLIFLVRLYSEILFEKYHSLFFNYPEENIFNEKREKSSENIQHNTTFPIKRLFVNESLTIYLTAAEAECLKLLIKTESITEVAKLLCKSERTVRAHIESCKKKLASNTLFELGNKLSKLPYFNFL